MSMNLVHRGTLGGSLGVSADTSDDPRDEVRANETERIIRQVGSAIEDVDAVRDSLTDLYRSVRPGTLAEVEVGDALQAVRTAMKRLRKAREELVNPPLPGM